MTYNTNIQLNQLSQTSGDVTNNPPLPSPAPNNIFIKLLKNTVNESDTDLTGRVSKSYAELSDVAVDFLLEKILKTFTSIESLLNQEALVKQPVRIDQILANTIFKHHWDNFYIFLRPNVAKIVYNQLAAQLEHPKKSDFGIIHNHINTQYNTIQKRNNALIKAKEISSFLTTLKPLNLKETSLDKITSLALKYMKVNDLSQRRLVMICFAYLTNTYPEKRDSLSAVLNYNHVNTPIKERFNNYKYHVVRWLEASASENKYDIIRKFKNNLVPSYLTKPVEILDYQLASHTAPGIESTKEPFSKRVPLYDYWVQVKQESFPNCYALPCTMRLKNKAYKGAIEISMESDGQYFHLYFDNRYRGVEQTNKFNPEEKPTLRTAAQSVMHRITFSNNLYVLEYSHHYVIKFFDKNLSHWFEVEKKPEHVIAESV